MFDLAGDTPTSAAVNAAIDAGLHADLVGLDDELLAREVSALVRERGRLDALIADRIATMRKRDLPEADGAASARAWLHGRLRLSNLEAGRLVKLSKLPLELPDTMARLEAGSISSEHAGVIARGVGDLGYTARIDAERLLLDQAPLRTPEELRGIVSRLRELLVPARNELDAESVREIRKLHLSPIMHSIGVLSGTLTPETTELLLALLEPLSKPLADDERTPGQRRHDALTELLQMAARAAGLPLVGGQSPHVTLTVDLDGLRDAARRLASPQEIGFCDAPRFDGLPPEVAGGLHIDDLPKLPRFSRTGYTDWRTALRLCCDAGVTRVVLAGGDMPINVGRETRIWNPAQRRALAVRYPCCVWPGCDRPVAWCEIDHEVEWELGGSTDLANGRPLCLFHHQLRHDGWLLARDSDGAWSAQRPLDWINRLSRRRARTRLAA